ncbi:PEP-CTERM sorting domain-containing protein [Nostoc sp. FACHB-110]|uniref:PEP-CTERM sorting domain-containing protein n=1 Tax=Nostoc sp. FACHB-110 TaxID=2692834 RepID=UPI0016824B5E|nr:PEP-CTERM sorting domain-containing protein [Nostoc sp. FACHB-110]MBD2438123.1 PEP-CTERM sorting domain-containing protein [Nostoc sp. FACHB-110]
MTLAKNLGFAAGIVAAISMATLSVKPAQAAILTYKFTANALSGDNPGQYFGSFTFDNSSLTNVGLEDIGVENGLKVAFNYLGNNYTEVDDDDYDTFPVLSFNNGNLLGLSYLVQDKFFIGGDIDNPGLGGNKFYTFELVDGASSVLEVGTVSYTKVPEPLSLGGTAIAGTLGLWLQRKKKLSKLAS